MPMNTDNRQLETESLTKALYHLSLAKEYLEDFKRTCRMEARRQAGLWVGKLDFTQQDIYSALTPRSRELYHEELKSGDLLFTQSISEKWIRMTSEQRDTLEMAADGILLGQFTIEKVNEK